MKKPHYLLTLFSVLLGVSCSSNTTEKQIDFTSSVNQSIGTGGHGHVFMGADVPFGLVQAGPTNVTKEGWDWCSGYHVSDSTVIGFSQTHLSGTGIGDFGDVTIMPVVGEVTPGRGTKEAPLSGQASFFKRKNEVYSPGYYRTFLDRFNVQAEMTTTSRTAMYRFVYTGSTDKSGVILDLENGSGWDAATDVSIIQTSKNQLVGYRNSKGWANDQKVAYAIKFSKPITAIQYWDKNIESCAKNVGENKLRYARLSFDMQAGDTLLANVALSPTDTEHALLNMESEIGTQQFDEIQTKATALWNNALGRIEVKSKDASVLENFYTALYHVNIAPVVFNDVDGNYRGADGKIYKDTSFQNYTIFSLWDTYRAAHPLFTLIQQERVSDMVNSMLHIYEQQGRLPVWHLWGCETDCMKGTPSCMVIADAILKGFPNIDKQAALAAMVSTQMGNNDGLDLLKKYGYIPSDLYNESVAEDMEYAIADAGVAKIATLLGDDENEAYFNKRSKSYKNYFDSTTGFMRGKFADGNWRTPFDPMHANHTTSDYTEGNAYQYQWLVPHDLEGLVELMGGTEKTIKNLDYLFTVTEELEEGASSDMTGLIGQYVHGNEPSHHIIYLYTLLGHPEKAAPLLREVMETLYTNAPDGLSGNEDVGQMSAWYVLSALGFYQVDPSGGDFIFGTPMVDEATINLPKGKAFHITAKNNSKENIYISKILLNGKKYTKPGISYEDIVSGGTLEYIMSDKPCSWMK